MNCDGSGRGVGTVGISASKLALLAVAVGATACGTDRPELRVSPTPARVQLTADSTLTLGQVVWDLPDALADRFTPAVDSIRSRLDSLGDGSSSVPVRVRLDSVATSGDTAARRALSHPEGYVLSLGGDGVEIVAGQPIGALHGLSTLVEAARNHDGRLPTGSVADWPVHRTRAMHFVARAVDVGTARRLINLARRNRLNTLIVQLADGVALPSMERIARPDAWSPDEFEDIVRYARENGLEFIPELKLLTHQGKLLKGFYPDLMYNSKTYDPREQRTYDVVFGMVEDVLDTVEPRALHIGHDEVAGVGSHPNVDKHLEPGEEPLPAELFLKDIRRVHEFLSERGVETWMWGDMLVSPSEFPDMLARHLHGDPAYTALRGQLPEDIVICDWHYADRQANFPSTLAFLDAGHPVLGAPWRHEGTTRRFSRYLAELNRERARGMIATTWWLVQRGRWEELEDILEFSGDAFWGPAESRKDGRGYAGSRSSRQPSGEWT